MAAVGPRLRELLRLPGAEVTTASGGLDQELTILWVLVCAFLVFFMQIGFALLESGTIRQKNVKNILLKNGADACIGTLCWWAVGHAFAYGKCGQSAFIGYFNFFSSNTAQSADGAYWAFWLFSWSFSATAATIISGAVAERLQFRAYAIYTIAISAFIYPVVVHWVWSASGWLSAFRQGCDSLGPEPYFTRTNGVMDFAGSGVVHMVGGGAGLMGTIILGPRLGRFLPDGKVAVNTTLAVASSGLSTILLAVVLGKAGDIGPLLNGVLAGAVAITAGCAVVQAYGAFIIGLVAAFVYTFSSILLIKLKIDDPLDAAPVHFFTGAWGVLAVGFFATETSTELAYGYANDWGVFYGGKGYQLGLQVLGIVMIAAWTCVLSGALFWLLNKACWLRVPREVEVKGLDLAQSLSSGTVGKFTNKYTTVVETHLTRASVVMPKSAEEDGMHGNSRNYG
ncbi:hypothetical protein N2152v2_008175 [Parachlorella kessleri]